MAAVLNFFQLGLPVSATPGAPDLVAAKDSGISTTDNITNNNNSSSGKSLQFTVTGTVAGATVSILADGVVIGSAVASGATTTVTTNGTSTLTDGTRIITAQQTEVGKAASALSGSLNITIDTTAPSISGAAFAFLTGHSIAYPFSENVSATLGSSDIAVQNTTTATTIPSAQQSISYNGGTNVATLSFPGVSSFSGSSILPDGNYTATVTASGVTDIAGNPMAANHVVNFFVLAGDADRSKGVDLTDFTILAANFNGTGKNWSQGDFSYNGTVDLTDFTILARNFNTSLPAAPAAALAVAVAPPAPATLSNLFNDLPIDLTKDNSADVL
jgi:hypothetical protein